MPEEVVTPVTEAPAAVETPAVPAVEAPAVDAAAAAEHGFANVDDAVAELKKVRREAAERRTHSKQYDDVFGSFEADEVEAFLDLAKNLGSGDLNAQLKAAERMKLAVAAIEEQAAKNGPALRPTGDPDPKNQPMTRAEYEAARAADVQSASEQAAVQKVLDEAKALGHEDGTASQALLLFYAQDPEIAGDLTKANEAVAKFKQAAIDEYAAAVAAGAQKWPSGQPVVAGGAAPADLEGGPPKDWKGARAALTARLKGRAGQA